MFLGGLSFGAILFAHAGWRCNPYLRTHQKVESLEVDHAPATEVGPKDDFGLKVDHAREHDVVFKVRS